MCSTKTTTMSSFIADAFTLPFSSQLDTKELIREYKKTTKRSILKIERELTKLKTSETININKIRKTPNLCGTDEHKNLGMEISGYRKQAKILSGLKTNMVLVGTKLETASSSNMQMETMKQASNIMRSINKDSSTIDLSNLSKEMTKNSMIMEDRNNEIESMMEDLTEDSMDDTGSSGVLDAIYDEMGLNLKSKLDTVRTPNIGGVVDPDEEELKKRLGALKTK